MAVLPQARGSAASGGKDHEDQTRGSSSCAAGELEALPADPGAAGTTAAYSTPVIQPRWPRQKAARQLGIRHAFLAGQVRQLKAVVATELLRTGLDERLTLTAYGRLFTRDVAPALESLAPSRSQVTRRTPRPRQRHLGLQGRGRRRAGGRVAHEPQRDPGLARPTESVSTASSGVMPDSRPTASEPSPLAAGKQAAGIFTESQQ